jgi:hypothetical protein
MLRGLRRLAEQQHSLCSHEHRVDLVNFDWACKNGECSILANATVHRFVQNLFLSTTQPFYPPCAYSVSVLTCFDMVNDGNWTGYAMSLNIQRADFDVDGNIESLPETFYELLLFYYY